MLIKKTLLSLSIITLPLIQLQGESAIASIICIVFMIFLHKFCHENVFNHLATHLNLKNGDDKNRPRDKFITNCWLFSIHVVLLLSLIIYIIYTNQLRLCLTPWNEYDWGHDYFNTKPPQPGLWSALTWVYALHIGFYVTEMLALVYDKPPGDFYELLFHHIATMSLIFGSMYFKREYFGVFIMFLHEIAEPFIVGGKFTHYAKWDKVSNAFFICFVLVWLPSRCMSYTYWVYIIPHCTDFGTGAEKAFFVYFLSCLQVLHWYWTVLIFKVAYGIITKPGGLMQMEITDEMDHSYSGAKTSELGKMKNLLHCLNKNGEQVSEGAGGETSSTNGSEGPLVKGVKHAKTN